MWSNIGITEEQNIIGSSWKITESDGDIKIFKFNKENKCTYANIKSYSGNEGKIYDNCEWSQNGNAIVWISAAHCQKAHTCDAENDTKTTPVINNEIPKGNGWTTFTVKLWKTVTIKIGDETYYIYADDDTNTKRKSCNHKNKKTSYIHIHSNSPSSASTTSSSKTKQSYSNKKDIIDTSILKNDDDYISPSAKPIKVNKEKKLHLY